MWTYHQLSGELSDADGNVVGWGYSGAGEGKNAPTKQNVPNVGPIPRGTYTIEPPHDSPTHGPFAMHLTPDHGNEMFGRSAFMCHGDSVKAPGTASEGCIIMPRAIREAVWSSGDHGLVVEA